MKNRNPVLAGTQRFKTYAAVLLALPLLLAATGESLAWKKTFSGTQAQVRTACAAVGGDLMDSPGSTTCFNNKNGTVATCYPDGTCDGAGPGRRVRVGNLDVFGTVVGLKPVHASEGPPELNSGGSDDGAGTSAGAGGSGWNAEDIGQWHGSTGHIN